MTSPATVVGAGLVALPGLVVVARRQRGPRRFLLAVGLLAVG